jgi:hypothetical protein
LETTSLKNIDYLVEDTRLKTITNTLFCGIPQYVNPLTTRAQSHLYAYVPEAILEIMQKHERQE